MNEALSVAQVAVILNVTPKYVVKLIRDGKGAPHRPQSAHSREWEAS